MVPDISNQPSHVTLYHVLRDRTIYDMNLRGAINTKLNATRPRQVPACFMTVIMTASPRGSETAPWSRESRSGGRPWPWCRTAPWDSPGRRPLARGGSFDCGRCRLSTEPPPQTNWDTHLRMYRHLQWKALNGCACTTSTTRSWQVDY